MKLKSLFSVMAAGLLLGSGASAYVIDNFSEGGAPTGNLIDLDGLAPVNDSDYETGLTTVMGGERDLIGEKSTGSSQSGSQVCSLCERWQVSFGPSSTGWVKLQWDQASPETSGDDEDLNPMAVGFDLTDGGFSDTVYVDIFVNDWPFTLDVTFADGDSTATVTQSKATGGFGYTWSWDMTAFTGIDFTDIRAAELYVTTGNDLGLDLEISAFRTGSVPVPTTLALLALGLLGAGSLRRKS